MPVHDLLGGKLRDTVAVRLLPLLPLRQPRHGQRGAHRRPAGRPRARAQGGARLHQRTSSRAACSRRTTSWSATARWPRRFPATASATTPTRALRSRRRSASAAAIEDLRNDYYEDPTWGLNGMRRVRAGFVRIPIATNTVVVNFEQLAANMPRPGRRRHPARHHLLGRHPALRQGRGGVRDLPARRRRALLRRARHPARHHAAPGRGPAQPHLRRRRALPPPDRRRHRRRQDALRDGRDRACPTARASASSSTATSSRSTPSSTASWAAIPTTATRAGRAGTRWSPTTAGPIRVSPCDLR